MRQQQPARRRAIRVRGIVQGVGFRPHVFRCAQLHGITGFVRNDPEGVLIEAQGLELDAFMKTLQLTLPPLARIDKLIAQPIAAGDETDFRIDDTRSGAAGGAAIPADLATCADCLGELFDRDNRRYLHPFIACCNCGPRYTMTRALPYDRGNTAMADFAMCKACEAEYCDPADRRFHAEPIACHDCGPRLSQNLEQTASALLQGKIVAIKGVGGYHLACDARNASAVRRLRQRKQRDGKPFAIMVLNRASAAQYCDLDDAANAALQSAERPVVILPATTGTRELSDELAGKLGTLGVMLPYTGLHYLLFHALLQHPPGTAWLEHANGLALVMTSANISGEPLLTEARDVASRLADVPDLFLHHDRSIAARADDSVLRIVDGQRSIVRRARGFTPHAIELEREGLATLALGAYLKSTITMTRGRQAHVSPHIGDLNTPAAIAFHAATAEAMERMLQQEVRLLACDLAEDYASTHLAQQISLARKLPLVRVQHHHAHVAAVLAEHRMSDPVLGLALDGHGEGDNGEAWGGELLWVNRDRVKRLGHLEPLPLPGGDRAAREPWRMAAGALHLLGRGGEIATRFADQPLASALAEWLSRGSIGVSSAGGRLFDAAAGLLGISPVCSFEAQAPMLLEALVAEKLLATDAFELNATVLSFRPLLQRLADCRDPVRGAREFHGTLLRGLTAWVLQAAEKSGLDTIVLCGGCFHNRYLMRDLPQQLHANGLRVLQPRAMPTNDGSISLGQAWVAQYSIDT